MPHSYYPCVSTTVEEWVTQGRQQEQMDQQHFTKTQVPISQYNSSWVKVVLLVSHCTDKKTRKQSIMLEYKRSWPGQAWYWLYYPLSVNWFPNIFRMLLAILPLSADWATSIFCMILTILQLSADWSPNIFCIILTILPTECQLVYKYKCWHLKEYVCKRSFIKNNKSDDYKN